MRVVPLTIFLFMVLFSIPSVYGQEEYTMKQLIPHGGIQVELIWPEDQDGSFKAIEVDEISNFTVRFVDSSSNKMVDSIAFDLVITQEEYLIENYHDEVADGEMVLQVLFIEKGPATIKVTVKSIGHIPVNELVTFSINVVPEFAFMAVIVMAVSMAIVITTRFNVITKLHLG